jgi:hypothetical protein
MRLWFSPTPATAPSPDVPVASTGDRQLMCRDCGGSFTWSAGEQAFYQQKGFAEPKRCKPCREQQRIARENRLSSSGNPY